MTVSGTPSHFEFTFGTLEGSGLPAKLPLCFDEGDDDPLLAACLRWCSANWSKATCEGSFRDRKPSMEPVFFFFFGDLESLEDAALEAVEARLDDVRLALSREGREEVEVALESGELGRS